ncbi:MAG: hypothetical protein KDD42_03270, partial [Bdellovibrionales bacterium]|nr:hypothetical protein [Bdellovibrionales bacterium]
EDFTLSDLPHKLSPPIRIKLYSNSPENQVDYTLSSSASLESGENVFRILRITREANLFTETDWNEATERDGLALLINSGDQEFKTYIEQSDVQKNVKLKTLLKLFQVYARETPPELSSSWAMVSKEKDRESDAK